MTKINALIRFYFHVDPDLLDDEKWAKNVGRITIRDQISPKEHDRNDFRSKGDKIKKRNAQFEEFIIKLKDQFSGGLRDADDALDDTRESADQLNDSFGKMAKVAGGIAVALGISEIASATKEFNKLKKRRHGVHGRGR